MKHASNAFNIAFLLYIIILKVILICTFWSNKKQLAYVELTAKPKFVRPIYHVFEISFRQQCDFEREQTRGLLQKKIIKPIY